MDVAYKHMKDSETVSLVFKMDLPREDSSDKIASYARGKAVQYHLTSSRLLILIRTMFSLIRWEMNKWIVRWFQNCVDCRAQELVNSSLSCVYCAQHQAQYTRDQCRGSQCSYCIVVADNSELGRVLNTLSGSFNPQAPSEVCGPLSALPTLSNSPEHPCNIQYLWSTFYWKAFNTNEMCSAFMHGK